jgi:hypothetical protein
MNAIEIPEVFGPSEGSPRPKARLSVEDVLDGLDTARACRLLQSVLWRAENSGNLNVYRSSPRRVAARTALADLPPCPDDSTPRALADFGTSRAAREAVCEALVFVADMLEYAVLDEPRTPGRKKRLAALEADRVRVCAVRRRLETELWP